MQTCILRLHPIEIIQNLSPFSRPIGVTIISAENIQVIDTIPERTFSLKTETVITANPQDWFANGISAKLLINPVGATIQLLVHPHDAFKAGIKAEVTSFQRPITKTYWTVFSPNLNLKNGIKIHFNLSSIIDNLKKANEAFKEFQIQTFAQQQPEVFNRWIQTQPRSERAFYSASASTNESDDKQSKWTENKIIQGP